MSLKTSAYASLAIFFLFPVSALASENQICDVQVRIMGKYSRQTMLKNAELGIPDTTNDPCMNCLLAAGSYYNRHRESHKKRQMKVFITQQNIGSEAKAFKVVKTFSYKGWLKIAMTFKEFQDTQSLYPQAQEALEVWATNKAVEKPVSAFHQCLVIAYTQHREFETDKLEVHYDGNEQECSIRIYDKD